MVKGLKSILAVICICLTLVSCRPSPRFLRDKALGKYPTTADFPNTKWVCKEIDLYFYMFDCSESYMIGEYTVNNVQYRVVGTFDWGALNFDIYSDTVVSESTLSDKDNMDGLVNCKRTEAGFIYTEYLYENEIINCTIRNCQAVLGETIPDKLTFEKSGTVAQSPVERWYSEELDMYLESFDDVSGYFSGEIDVGGSKCLVHALEVGNNNYFMLTIENGVINTFKPRTTGPFVWMYFEHMEDSIIAKVSDEVITNSVAYPYWTYGTESVVFTKC